MKQLTQYMNESTSQENFVNESIDTKSLSSIVSNLEAAVKKIKSVDKKFYEIEISNITRAIDTIKENISDIESGTYFEPGDIIVCNAYKKDYIYKYGIVKSVTSSEIKLVAMVWEEPSRHLRSGADPDKPEEWTTDFNIEEFAGDDWRLATDEERGDMFRILRYYGWEYNPSSNTVKKIK